MIRGKRRMMRQISAERKERQQELRNIATHYNCVELKSISEWITHRNLDLDALQQQETASGSSPVRQEQETEATARTRSQKLDR